ncbi:hypothetical protein B0H34DRAFT_725170, partial [Crassisporium funariophilum]
MYSLKIRNRNALGTLQHACKSIWIPSTPGTSVNPPLTQTYTLNPPPSHLSQPPTSIPRPAEPRTSTISDIRRHFTCTLTSFPMTASTVSTSKRKEHPTPGTTIISRPSDRPRIAWMTA